MSLHVFALFAASNVLDGYSFSPINAAQSAPITHVFSVANTTEKPVTIDRLQSSCGCTIAVLDGAPTPGKPTVIHPVVQWER